GCGAIRAAELADPYAVRFGLDLVALDDVDRAVRAVDADVAAVEPHGLASRGLRIVAGPVEREAARKLKRGTAFEADRADGQVIGAVVLALGREIAKLAVHPRHGLDRLGTAHDEPRA